jgi:hypothetical protein
VCRILDGSIGYFDSAGMVEVKRHTTNSKLAEKSEHRLGIRVTLFNMSVVNCMPIGKKTQY